MFALEIQFQDSSSQSMMILVRHPHVVIGASEKDSNVAIEDMRKLNLKVNLTKKLGSKFLCKVETLNGNESVFSKYNKEYERVATLDFKQLQIVITSLDVDLAVRAGEPPDKAGVRILKQACTEKAADFPAVVVNCEEPIVVSFPAFQTIYAGRSNKCALRFNSEEVSAKHARVGFENGEFWIEDLGSTNGTFVNSQQISGRVNIEPRTLVFLGNKVSFYCINSQADYEGSCNEGTCIFSSQSDRKYPILISLSAVARPQRLILPLGIKVVLGRTPNSDMWIAAPHISRKHCEFTLIDEDRVIVEDCSTNGTAYDNKVLHNGKSLELINEPKVFNFGGNLTAAICFNDEQVKDFVDSGGDLNCFYALQYAPFGTATEVNDDSTLSGRYESSVATKSVYTDNGNILKRLKKIFNNFSLRKKLLFITTIVIGVILLLVIFKIIVGSLF